MLMDQITKRHRGFGFVTFVAEETVDVVCDLHYHTIKNKKVEVKKAQPKENVLSSSTAALLGRRLVMLPSPAAPAAPAVINIPLLQQQSAAYQQQQQQQSLGLNSQIGMNSFEGKLILLLPLKANVNYLSSGKMLPTSQSLSSLRYSPYQTSSLTSAPAPQLQSLPLSLQYSGVPQYTTNTPVDLSHLTGALDWSQLGIISLQ